MLNSFLITQLTLAALGAPGVGPEVTEPHVKARLLADASAIKPGGKVMLAAQFVVDREWHIYWRNNGPAAGLPTSIHFAVPKGWRVGPLLYPAPISHGDTPDDKTFILDGPAPMILAELTAPPDAKPGQTIKIAAEVGWLVCKLECIKGDVKLALDLPVVSAGAKVEPANESEFKKARRALPVPMAEAKYLKVRSVQSPAEIKPGQKFKIEVVLDVEKGYHIQSAKKTVEGLVRTELFLDAPRGVLTEEPTYPAGKERVVKDVGKVSEYAGSVRIAVDGETEPDIALKPIKIYANLRYQACNEAGTCYPPINAEFVISLKVAGAKAASADDGDDDNVAVASTSTPSPPPNAPVSPVGASASSANPSQRTLIDRVSVWLQSFGVVGYLIMAFIGGFVMNFMPCVLPVISIKVLSFVRQAHEHRLRILLLGASFSLGIIVSFAALGIAMRVFDLGWGQLFQYPRVIIGLSAVVMAMALSLFGVFSLNPPRAINELGEKVQGEGPLNAFGSGLLATALGTACSAPLISVVIALAAKQTPTVAFAIFLAAGVGMAFPYLALTAHPAWVRFVPRPGPWMGTFERVMGLLLLATVVWLLSPLPTQLGADGLIWTLVFLVFVATATWLYGRLEYGASWAQKSRTYASVLGVIVIGWFICFRWKAPIDERMSEQVNERRRLANLTNDASQMDDLKLELESLRAQLASANVKPSSNGASNQASNTSSKKNEIKWRPYTPSAAESAIKAGKTIFIDYTADWCVNCKANERLVLNTEKVMDALQDYGVVAFKADYTLPDPDIKADLAKHGRSGVPMYVVFPAKKPDGAIVLPEVLTPSIVIDAIKSAGPSAGITPKSSSVAASNSKP